MFKAPALRQLGRAIGRSSINSSTRSTRLSVEKSLPSTFRSLSTSQGLRKPTEQEFDDATTSSAPGASGKHEGQFARTSESLRFDHPEEHEMPRSAPVTGRGGEHSLPTLAAFSLEGQVVALTGGARGLGLVMTQACVISGADVAIIDLNKEEADKQAASLLKSYKEENPKSDRTPKITAHYADVSNPDSVSKAYAEVVEAHGKVDNLVTSAGFCENIDAVSYPFDRMQKLWGVNVNGTYLFAIEHAKHLMGRQSGGSVVCIGSMSGAIVNVPQPQAPYNASKAAVRHLVSSLAVEWAHANIRVNCISPGYMLTALTKKILDENPELHRQWTSLIPQGKMGRPEDLMGAVVFLCSNASSYVTGADLRVDGGYTAT